MQGNKKCIAVLPSLVFNECVITSKLDASGLSLAKVVVLRVEVAATAVVLSMMPFSVVK